jgi:two-component system, NtrC family, sensor kinase
MDKLLLIDDEPDILRVLGISLKADGYHVIPALNGAEGLEAFSRDRPSIVITDIKMPGMDGIEVLEKIKEIDPDTEVIIITGHGDIDNAIESLKYGASDFINKPVRDEALSIALARAKEKLDIKRRLKEYTTDLEKKIELATSELRRQTNFQIKLIRSSNDGIVATDQELKIVIYNPGAEKIFGYFQSEVIYKMQLEALYPAEITGLFHEALRADTSLKEIAWRETEITCKDGEQIPVRFSGTILTENEREMGTVAFFQDLREIKRLEKELVKSERLAAVGQTVAGLAHGIKNILHGLKGGSYLVDIGIQRNDTEKLKKGWETIKRNIGRTSNLVMDLLSYSKERTPEYEVCRPNEIINDVCELLKAKAEENNIEILTEFDDAVGEVVMDGSIIHEALLNLASNAVDACLFDEDVGKKWQVRLKTVMEPENIIKFEVTDNGAGMDQEVLQKLFTSFFSTKGHRGTGLGLMVTRKIIEEHQGRIEVASQLGQGTTFTVRLPYKVADAV